MNESACLLVIRVHGIWDFDFDLPKAKGSFIKAVINRGGGGFTKKDLI